MLPTADGCFILYSDTSRTYTGSALWQIQDGFPCLIGYASKTLPPAAANYSVTELEMTGLLMNIHAWHGWTQGAEVDVTVDHKAVVQILKSKELPATGHIGLLIRKLGPLPFNLYYVKGKDLILTDFLSWIKSDHSDPSEVLPISFVDMQMTNPPPEYKLQIRTCSSAKCEGATVPPVHGIEKVLDPHKKPEHQSPQPNARPPPAPAGPYPTPPLIQKPSPAMTASKKLIGHGIKTLNKHKQPTKTRTSHPPKFQIPPPDAPLIPQFHPLNPNTPMPAFQPQEGKPHMHLKPTPALTPPAGPLPEPIPQRQAQPLPMSALDPYPIPQGTPSGKTFYAPAHMPANPRHIPGRAIVDPAMDLGIPLESYKDLIDLIVRRPNADDLARTVPLAELIDVGKLNIRDLPKQSKIDPVLKLIQSKILRQIHLPTSFRDLHGAYLNSPHFRDIYLYLLQNKAPKSARERGQIISMSQDYMLLDNLLFKITKDRITMEAKPLLCIPMSKVQLLLHYFHSSMMGGHMGITKTYMTLGQCFHCPNLTHHV